MFHDVGGDIGMDMGDVSTFLLHSFSLERSQVGPENVFSCDHVLPGHRTVGKEVLVQEGQKVTGRRKTNDDLDFTSFRGFLNLASGVPFHFP